MLEMSEIFIFISTLESTGFKGSVAEGANPAERTEALRPSLHSRESHSNLLKNSPCYPTESG